MKYVKIIKPGTAKNQLVKPEEVEFYRQYGWEQEITEVSARLKPRRNTAKAEPAVEVNASEQEVGKDELKGD